MQTLYTRQFAKFILLCPLRTRQGADSVVTAHIDIGKRQFEGRPGACIANVKRLRSGNRDVSGKVLFRKVSNLATVGIECIGDRVLSTLHVFIRDGQ